MDANPTPTTCPNPPAADPCVGEGALDDIVTGLASVHREVPPTPGHPPAEPRSLRLLGTATYDVWLITWPARSEMGSHDHGPATSVMRVVSGAVEEELGGWHRRLGPGTSVTTPPGTVHRLANLDDAEATTLHAYSPPLRAVTYHEPASGDRATKPRVTPVRSRRAEATSPPGWAGTGEAVPDHRAVRPVAG